jgi:hypothetical protein
MIFAKFVAYFLKIVFRAEFVLTGLHSPVPLHHGKNNSGQKKEQTMAETFGNVYVFNESGANITAFILNNVGSAGSIAGLSEATTPPYEPFQLAVGRTNLLKEQLDSPLFVEGANSIVVVIEGENWAFTITIPPPPGGPGLALDLLLHIYFYAKKAILLDNIGNILDEAGAQ